MYMSNTRLIDPETGTLSNGNQLTYLPSRSLENLENKKTCYHFKYGINIILFLITTMLLSGSIYTFFQKNFDTDTNYFSNFRIFIICCAVHSLSRIYFGYSMFRIYYKKNKCTWWLNLLAFISELVMIAASLYVYQTFRNTVYFNTDLWKIAEFYTCFQVIIAVGYLLLLFTYACCN